MKTNLQLARYDAMVLAINECHRVDEVKELRDQAKALETYAQQAMNIDSERKAAQIRIRAERRCGEMLAAMAKDGQRDKGKGGDRKSLSRDTTVKTTTLSDLGITRDQSAKWQQLAQMSTRRFEENLNAPGIPTTEGMIRAVNGATRCDRDSLWIWGRVRDFERDGIMQRSAADLFGGMTDKMQADMRRLLADVLAWLHELEGAVSMSDLTPNAAN